MIENSDKNHCGASGWNEWESSTVFRPVEVQPRVGKLVLTLHGRRLHRQGRKAMDGSSAGAGSRLRSDRCGWAHHSTLSSPQLPVCRRVLGSNQTTASRQNRNMSSKNGTFTTGIRTIKSLLCGQSLQLPPPGLVDLPGS